MIFAQVVLMCGLRSAGIGQSCPFGSCQPFEEGLGAVKSWQCIDQFTVRVQNIVNAVSGNGPLDFATISEINGDSRHRPHRLPMQYEMLPQILRDFGVWIKRCAKEPAVSATIFLVQISQ